MCIIMDVEEEYNTIEDIAVNVECTCEIICTCDNKDLICTCVNPNCQCSMQVEAPKIIYAKYFNIIIWPESSGKLATIEFDKTNTYIYNFDLYKKLSSAQISGNEIIVNTMKSSNATGQYNDILDIIEKLSTLGI
jgi:hypothetical protein